MLYYNDIKEIYQAVEEAICINSGVNRVIFNVKGIIGAGVGHSTRYYYVPVYFPNVDASLRYKAVLVTVRPLSSPNRTSGAMMIYPDTSAPLSFSNYNALLAAIAADSKVANDTSAPISAVANMAC